VSNQPAVGAGINWLASVGT